MSKDSQKAVLSEEDAQALKRYMIFSNGDGYMVLEDLKHVFRHFKSDEFNEELEQIPHPYREYVKAGCRMVMDKIDDTILIAEEYT